MRSAPRLNDAWLASDLDRDGFVVTRLGRPTGVALVGVIDHYVDPLGPGQLAK
jgi:hypothetical protein